MCYEYIGAYRACISPRASLAGARGGKQGWDGGLPRGCELLIVAKGPVCRLLKQASILYLAKIGCVFHVRIYAEPQTAHNKKLEYKEDFDSYIDVPSCARGVTSERAEKSTRESSAKGYSSLIVASRAWRVRFSCVQRSSGLQLTSADSLAPRKQKMVITKNNSREVPRTAAVSRLTILLLLCLRPTFLCAGSGRGISTNNN